MLNQGVRQAADASSHQLEPLAAEVVEMEAKAKEVSFTLIVVTVEMVTETVAVVAMTVTTTITVMMIPKMVVDTLQICVVTTCVLLLLHCPLLHQQYLQLI